LLALLLQVFLQNLKIINRRAHRKQREATCFQEVVLPRWLEIKFIRRELVRDRRIVGLVVRDIFIISLKYCFKWI